MNSTRVKLKWANLWCKVNRSCFRLRELWRLFYVKLKGHIQHYGVSFNIRSVHRFCRRAIVLFWKSLNRESQRRSITFDRFVLCMKVYPPPKITVSCWSDLDSIKNWKQNMEHRNAQKLGLEKWYNLYKVRISRVERDYGI